MLVLQCAEERFRLVSYRNKVVSPPEEYVDPGLAAAPFALQPATSTGGRFVPPPQPEDPWTLQSGKARQVTAGGRPAVQIDLTLRHQQLRAHYHLLAYPRTAVLRQWVGRKTGQVRYWQDGQGLVAIGLLRDNAW